MVIKGTKSTRCIDHKIYACPLLYISPRKVAAANVLLQGCVAPYSQSAGRSIPKDKSLNGDLRPSPVEDHV